MAFSNPQVYLSDLARPLYNRFEADPTSYELAISTCIILYHFADVVSHVRSIKPHEAAQLISESIPDFQTIRALANAGKHVELNRHPNPALVGLRAEHLLRDKGAAFDDGTFFSDGTSFSDIPETIVVTTPDNTKYDVLHTCRTVLEKLEKNDALLQV